MCTVNEVEHIGPHEKGRVFFGANEWRTNIRSRLTQKGDHTVNMQTNGRTESQMNELDEMSSRHGQGGGRNMLGDQVNQLPVEGTTAFKTNVASDVCKLMARLTGRLSSLQEDAFSIGERLGEIEAAVKEVASAIEQEVEDGRNACASNRNA